MPETKTLTITGSELQPGDVFVLPRKIHAGDPVVEVRSIEPKIKWAHVNRTHGSPVRVQLDESIEVRWEVPTEEERAADQRRMLLAMAQREWKTAQEEYDRARSRVTTGLEEVRFDHWLIEPLMRAQAVVNIWERVSRAQVRRTEQGEDVDLFDGVEEVTRDLARKLLRGEYQARSSSQVWNAEELMEGQVASDFVQRWGCWIGLPVGWV